MRVGGENFPKESVEILKKNVLNTEGLKIKKGDTVVTTAYNSVYPANHPIGRIEEVSVDENQPFWDIKVRLFENHQKLEHCYAYKNQLFFEKAALIQQKDSLY